MTNIKRKGARSKKDIPVYTLEQLNNGEIESANLVEWLAIDRRLLLENLLVQHSRTEYINPVLAHVSTLKKQTINTVGEAIGTELLNQINIHHDDELRLIIANHQSDLVRSWGTFIIGKDPALNIEQMLQNIKPFAADRHFNVREEAWIAVRPTIANNLHDSIRILSEWALDADENMRRFSSEATRPRGVWCAHIEALKQSPELALSILEPLKSDESKYVQNSVGNWLNDASKTQPKFVVDLCKCWGEESNTKETEYIIKKSLRTINKPPKFN